MQLCIAICDDEQIEINYLKNLVNCWARKSGVAVRIACFESAESFLFTYSENKNFDVLLLDIQMGAMDGVQLAKKIRLENKDLQIIFITGFSEFMSEGYEVSALHYLMKPVREEKLFEVLSRATGAISKQEQSLMLTTTDGVNIRILIDDIVFVEVFDHLLEINMMNGKIEVKMSLSSLESMLTDRFIRCHRGCSVNLQHIKKITKTAVTLDCGKELPLSRRLYTEVNRAMLRFLKGGDTL